MGRKKFFAPAIVAAVLIIGGYFLAWRGNHHTQEAVKPTVTVYHYSYFSQKDFYEQAYADAGKQAAGLYYNPNIKAVMVNHHLLAASYIAEEFNQIATSAPVTVLLVSPNHFDAGSGSIITSAGIWKTPYGDLLPDVKLINQLTTGHAANIEEDPFQQEHGVSGIAAFIKKSLPNAKVVPVIFRNRMTLEQALDAANQFHKILPSNVLVVGSFDFSHYLTSNAADFHDVDNLAAVKNLDAGSTYHLDIDSRPGLAFFLRLMQDEGAENFTLLEHSNSAKLAKQDILETTSYIDGYFTPGSAASSAAQTLLSLPSIIPSSKIISAMQKSSPAYALTYMERLFYGQDAAVAFLESPDASLQSVLGKFYIQPVVNKSFDYNLGTLKVKILDCQRQPESSVYAAMDAGADAVVCQGALNNRVEIYKNKPIVYAAGNLLDSVSINNQKTSLAVGLAVVNNRLKIFLLPIGADGKQLKLLIGAESDRVLSEIAGGSSVPQEIKNEIKNGVVNIK